MSDILQTIFSPACLFTGYVIALPIQILYDGYSPTLFLRNRKGLTGSSSSR